MIIGVTRADCKHCWKITNEREELNRSVREVRIESRHYIKNFYKGWNQGHMTVVPVTSVEVTDSEAILALSLSTYNLAYWSSG